MILPGKETLALLIFGTVTRAISTKNYQIIKGVFFGHLKSAKSSENGIRGFAEKNFSYQKNGNSENDRVGRLRREKCQKNGNGMLKK